MGGATSSAGPARERQVFPARPVKAVRWLLIVRGVSTGGPTRRVLNAKARAAFRWNAKRAKVPEASQSSAQSVAETNAALRARAPGGRISRRSGSAPRAQLACLPLLELLPQRRPSGVQARVYRAFGNP